MKETYKVSTPKQIKFGDPWYYEQYIPADFYRLNKSQLRRISEYACDSFISEMFNVTQKEVKRRRHDFGLKINSLAML